MLRHEESLEIIHVGIGCYSSFAQGFTLIRLIKRNNHYFFPSTFVLILSTNLLVIRLDIAFICLGCQNVRMLFWKFFDIVFFTVRDRIDLGVSPSYSLFEVVLTPNTQVVQIIK